MFVTELSLSDCSATHPHPIDIHVGSRLRERRIAAGVTQEGLAEALAVTFQQVQKYERGANRISASKLWEAARRLQVQPSYFFEEMPDDLNEAALSALKDDPLHKRESLELVRYFQDIEDKAIKRLIYSLVKTISQNTCQEIGL
ncbi:MAG: helix-turn-helix transcriptional regulator [Alphaproteobacteria bacterium]|nr:helix-turn-helix transcriptional regulator [Alphaproteobacteria bacterium]